MVINRSTAFGKLNRSVQKKRGAALVKVAVVLIVMALAIRTWAFMVLLGMLAGYTGMHGLAIGFWAALGVNALVGLGLFSGRSSGK